jgi:hypothetical protein
MDTTVNVAGTPPISLIILSKTAHLRTYVSHGERGVPHVWIANEVCSRCHVATIIARVIVVFSAGLQMAAGSKEKST